MFRVGIAYALIAWVVLQIVDFLVQVIGAPTWVLQVFFIAGAIGLLGVVIFSWVYEMTPEGLKRESEVDRTRSITPQTGRKLDRIIIVFLAVAVVFLLAERYWHPPAQPTETLTGAKTAEAPTPAALDTAAMAREKSVAVLPFVALSSGPDDGYFADGLTEEILNALAQLPELLVTARSSAFAFKGQDTAVQQIGAELGVQHIVEGSVRRAGDRLRVTAQLVRVEDGFHLWSESYDSTSADTISVQEDIATQIARALDVVLDEERREAMSRAGLRDPAAFVAFQRGWEASREAHGDAEQITGLLEANRYFDQVLDRVPGYPPALLEHADAYVHIINDASTSEPTLGDISVNPESAYDLAVNDLALALENARSLDERNTIEFDLAIVTGDFYRIRQRLEAYLTATNCEHPNWVDPMATIFGYAAELRKRLDSVIACDPLGPVIRFAQARAAIWADDPEGALELVEQARQRLDHRWIDQAGILALLSAGRLESAENEVMRKGDDRFYTFLSSSKLAAVRGDEELARRLLEQIRNEFGLESIGYFLELQFFAQIGDRAEANRRATSIDEQAYGPLPLILITMWCACGAPFDLEATPNFAAKLEQGDLPWPPSSPLELPLKDW